MQHVVDHIASAVQAPPRLQQELRETLQRLRLGGPFYVMLWLFAGVAADVWLHAPLTFVAISLGFVGLTVVRFRVRGVPESSDQAAVHRRLDYIWLLLLVNAALWGVAAAWLLLVAPEESARTVAAISSYAFATAFAHNFPMRLRKAFAAVFLIYLPTLAALVASGARYELVGVSALYLLYVSLALRRSHADYLQRLDLEDALRQQRDLFQQQSRRDGLTGLANRRRFSAAMQEWTRHSRDTGEPLILLVLDLDHFKSVNDEHGHAVGDACLRIFADTLQHVFPSPPDLPARLGGEEFAVLVRPGRLDDTLRRADVLRLSLPEISCREGAGVPLYVSIGAARFDPERHIDPDELYREADAALYRAKAQGRNRVVAADDYD